MAKKIFEKAAAQQNQVGMPTTTCYQIRISEHRNRKKGLRNGQGTVQAGDDGNCLAFVQNNNNTP